MRLALIVAAARNGVIGASGRLPWRLPEDLRRFRSLTTGHTIVMGRKTWESLPHALPGRQNIVVTRQLDYLAPGAQSVPSLDVALARVAMPEPAYCIGGGELFRIALPLSEVIHLTEIDQVFEGDAYFPSLDPAQWQEVSREQRHLEGPEGFDYAFVTYNRRAV